jgi:hypothetical protein
MAVSTPVAKEDLQEQLEMIVKCSITVVSATLTTVSLATKPMVRLILMTLRELPSVISELRIPTTAQDLVVMVATTDHAKELSPSTILKKSCIMILSVNSTSARNAWTTTTMSDYFNHSIYLVLSTHVDFLVITKC